MAEEELREAFPEEFEEQSDEQSLSGVNNI